MKASSHTEVRHRVPQVSVLGPLLFRLYLITLYCYADDTLLYSASGKYSQVKLFHIFTMLQLYSKNSFSPENSRYNTITTWVIIFKLWLKLCFFFSCYEIFHCRQLHGHRGLFHCWSFLSNILRSLPYSVKCFEATVVVIWCSINQIALNWTEIVQKISFYPTSL